MKEWRNRSTTTTWKIINIFQVKNEDKCLKLLFKLDVGWERERERERDGEREVLSHEGQDGIQDISSSVLGFLDTTFLCVL